VSALYYVFGVQALRPIARYSLASTLVFLAFTPIPLLVHLGDPLQGLNILLTPSFTSAKAGFGFIIGLFALVVLLQAWFAFRSDLIQKARAGGVMGGLARVLCLGNTTESAATRRADERLIRILGGIGIPLAVLLHGYVGFLFGSVKANPWWSTPLMFVIFVFSAIVSGMAVLTFHYVLVSWINRWPIDRTCLHTLGRYLWGFMIVAVGLELLELLSIAYQQTAAWTLLRRLINERLWVSYVVLQFLVFSLVPFFLLMANALLRLRERISTLAIWVAAGFLLGQVLLMRWNVIIGGQLLSKSQRGLMEYFPRFWEKEGLVMAAAIFTVPFLLLWIIHRFVNLFPGNAAPASPDMTP
jgi:predicted membrane protein